MAISETHDLGRLYVHAMHVPRGGPVLERGTTHEVNSPWRTGRCVVLRVWKAALVVGWWGAERTYEEMVAAETAEKDAGVLPSAIREDFRPQPQPDVDASGWVVR